MQLTVQCGKFELVLPATCLPMSFNGRNCTSKCVGLV
jgi:hypothetical protein